MSQEKRQFTGFIRVQTDTKKAKLELSPAEIYGGAEGLLRVRLNRRWLNAPDKTPFFCDKAKLAEIVARQVFGEETDIVFEEKPDIPMNARVTVKYWDRDDWPRWEGGFVSTPPILAFDGHYYVGVSLYGGCRFFKADDIIIRRR